MQTRQRGTLFLSWCIFTAVSLSACKTAGKGAKLQSDESVTISATNASNPLALGVGVDAFTGNSTNYTCVIGTSNTSSGSANRPNAPSPMNKAPVVPAGISSVAQVPSFGVTGLQPVIIAQDLQRDPGVAPPWNTLLASGALKEGTPEKASLGLEDGSSTGLTFYLTLYDDSSTAKSELDSSASATFSALLGGTNADLSGKFANVFSSGNQSQYLVIDGIYRGYAEFLTNPTVPAMYAATLANWIKAPTTANWAPFAKRCGNMYVNGLVHGARFKAVIAVSKNSGQTTATAGLGLKVGTPAVAISLGSVQDFLRAHAVTSMAMTTDGGAVVSAASVDDLIKGVNAWTVSLADATSKHQLPAQFAILEPYQTVGYYQQPGPGGAGTELTPLPNDSCPDPLSEPRGSMLRHYRSYYNQVTAAIDRLSDAGQVYQTQLEAAHVYRDSLVKKARDCVAESSACTQIASPSTLALPKPAITPAAPAAPAESPVTAFDVGYDLLRQATLVSYRDSLCSRAIGGSHLPTAGQLSYLLKHNEILFSGYSLLQWVPSGGIWTSETSGNKQTVFLVDQAKNASSGGKVTTNVDRTSFFNPFGNDYYVVCVLP